MTIHMKRKISTTISLKHHEDFEVINAATSIRGNARYCDCHALGIRKWEDVSD